MDECQKEVDKVRTRMLEKSVWLHRVQSTLGRDRSLYMSRRRQRLVRIALLADMVTHEQMETEVFDELFVQCAYPIEARLHWSLTPTDRVNECSWSRDEFMRMFRFEPSDIRPLVSALGLPAWFQTSQRYSVSNVEAMLILLRRWSYPNRLHDLRLTFHRSEAELSAITNTTIKLLMDKWGHLAASGLLRLDLSSLLRFTHAISGKGICSRYRSEVYILFNLCSCIVAALLLLALALPLGRGCDLI